MRNDTNELSRKMRNLVNDICTRTSTDAKPTVELEINKELVLSTKHIPEPVNSWLSSEQDALVVHHFEYGFRLLAVVNEDIPVTPFKELNGLLELAHGQGCKWLVLDRDGQVCEALPQFDW